MLQYCKDFPLRESRDMEDYKAFGGRVGLICFSLGVFLLLQHAHARAENRTDPTANVNLSPIWAWRSAFFCFLKKGPVCADKWKVTDKGIVDVVGRDEVGKFCNATTGCAQHALDVLECIHLVKRDFSFGNKASVALLNQTIVDGCARNSSERISTANYKSSGIKVYQKIYIPFVASLSTLAFIAMFNNM